MEIANLFELTSVVTSADDNCLLETLRRSGLLREKLRCRVRNCRRFCILQKHSAAVLGSVFFCRSCRKRYSVLFGSFFEKSRFPLRNVLVLLWHWVCEIGSGVVAVSLGCPKASVVQYYRLFRHICSRQLICEEGLFLLGGVGHTVQIDEYVMKRKDHVDRIVTQKWVLGIYDLTVKRGYLVFIPNRSAETLESIIINHVRPGSEIWTDCWQGYGGLSSLGGVSPYIHRTVNRSSNFVDPATGVCTNHIQGYWSSFKQFLRRLGVMSSPFLSEYVDQFMWWSVYGSTSAQERFLNITRQISEQYEFRS